MLSHSQADFTIPSVLSEFKEEVKEGSVPDDMPNSAVLPLTLNRDLLSRAQLL